MKKLVLTIALVSFCFSTNAQDSKFGITAGFQSTSIKVSGGSFDISQDAFGFFLVFMYNFYFQKLLVFNPSFSILQFLLMEKL
tara:strand:+ start:133 stop:381 length:249 start_codon:yes stop_codon:yes gene_type:complete